MEKQTYLRRVLAGALVLLLAIPLVNGIGTAGAKYLRQGTNTGFFRAKEFYFNSNMLGTDAPEHIINATYDSVTFELHNFTDALHFTEETTYCTLQLGVKEGGSLTDESLSVDEVELDGNSCSSETVTLSDMKPGITYTVTATAKTGDPLIETTGYKQTLSATFRLSNLDEGFYYHLSNEYGVYTLEVWAENVNGSVDIRLPEGLEPDNNNLRMEAIRNKNGDVYKAFTIADDISFDSPGGGWTYTFFAQPKNDLTNADLEGKITMTLAGGATYNAAHRIPG
jgi:hypothetical protein